MNKAIIVGRLGRDPESTYSQAGTAICNLSVATDESYKDQSGNKVEKTEWHKVTAFGKPAEFCGRYLSKGRLVLVEGSLQTDKWTDKQGVERYTTKIKAMRVQALDKAQDQPQPQQPAQQPAQADNSDVPF